MACACGQCDNQGPWRGELCLWRTADKTLDVLWFRCDGPVRFTDAAAWLIDVDVELPLTELLLEPDQGRIHVVIRAEQLEDLDDEVALKVMAADETGLRSVLVLATVTIQVSGAGVLEPAVPVSVTAPL